MYVNPPGKSLMQSESLAVCGMIVVQNSMKRATKKKSGNISDNSHDGKEVRLSE